MKKTIVFITVLLTLVFFVPASYAQTPGAALYVAPTGSDSNDGSQDSPFFTIQKAIDTAVSPAVVRVAGGTYNERIYINNKEVSIYGGFNATTWARDGNPTIIDARNTATTGDAVSYRGTAVTRNTVLDGVTVYGAIFNPGEDGTTFWIGNGAPTISNVIIYGPESDGKVYTIQPLSGANPLFKNCKIYGGKGFGWSKIITIGPWNASSEFEDCEIFPGSNVTASYRTLVKAGNSHNKFTRTIFHAPQVSQNPNATYFIHALALGDKNYPDNYSEFYDCVLFGANAGDKSSHIIHEDGAVNWLKYVISNTHLVLGSSTGINEFFNGDLEQTITQAGGVYQNVYLWNSVEEYIKGRNLFSITTTSLALAKPGIPYAQTLTVYGGTAPYTWSLNSGSLPNGISLSSEGILSGTATEEGTFNFTVQVTDSSIPAQNATRDLTLTVAVAPNNPPLADSQSVTLAEDSPKAVSLTAADPDNDALTYSVVAQPAHGALSGIAPSLTYTPNANYLGTDSFTFKANDGKADSNIATISLTIIPKGFSGLAAYYTFDNNTSDYSGNNNHGTIYGNPQYVSGKTGQALSFDGAGDYVEIADSPALALGNQGSVLFWVKSQDKQSVIITKGDASALEYSFGAHWSGAYTADIRNNTSTSNLMGGAFKSDIWQQIALVFNELSASLYVDGAIVASQAFSGGLNNSAVSIHVGSNRWNNAFFTGSIDELAIYNKELSASEIQQLYQQGSDIIPPTTTASPLGGTYDSAQTVTLTVDETAVIHYTLDGSTPTPSSPVYASPLTIAQNTTLKFFAIDTAGNQEQVKTENYIINPSPIGSYYVASDGSDTNSGSVSSPFKTIARALSLAKTGETVYLRAGAYSELISFPTAGISDTERITLKAYNKEAVTITQTGRVMNIGQPYITVEGLIFDANRGDDDAVKIYSTANFAVLRGLEIRNTRRDAIDMSSPQGVLIENSKIHDAIWVDGLTRYDAHGIVTAGVKDLIIRAVEIYYVSGDAIQFQYGGWNNVLIEDSVLWNGPLPTARGGAPAGVYLGENAVDTKYYLSDGRGRLTIRNVTAYGWKNDYLVNAAAFNLKHNVEVILDGITTYDNDIAFRLRGPSPTYGGAWVTLKNALIYASIRGVRYEDKIENLHIYHTTWGKGTGALFENAGGYGVGFEAKNNLFLSAVKPVEAGDPSNFAAADSDFKNPAGYDYHLNPGASMIDKGIALPEVAIDREGMSRPQGAGVDPGAYEYQGTALPPPAWLDSNSPLALNLHPRLLFIPQSYRDANPNAVGITVQEMRDKLVAYYKTEFQSFVTAMDGRYSDGVSTKDRKTIIHDAMNFAFLYMIDPASMSQPPYNFSFSHTRAQYGAKAKEHALQIAQNIINNPTFSKGGWQDDGYNYMYGPINATMAMVYDWSYPLFTKSERQFIADGIIKSYEKAIQNYDEIARYRQGLLENNKLGDAQNGDIGSLVMWGDDLDNPGSTYYADKSQFYLDKLKYDWLERIYDFSNYIFEGSSNWTEGPVYDKVTYTTIPLPTGLISSALNYDYFYNTSYFRKFGEYKLFNSMPFPYNINSVNRYVNHHADDDDPDEDIVDNYYIFPKGFYVLIGALNKSDPVNAGLLKWWKNSSGYLQYNTVLDTNVYWDIFRFFWGEAETAEKSPAQINLPLSTKLGMNQYVMRTGFTSSNDSFLSFDAPKYFEPVGHAHREFAGFLIAKYGNLAIQRSIRKSFTGGNIDSTSRASFYNTISVYKPGELFYQSGVGYNLASYRENFDEWASYKTDLAYQSGGANHVGNILAQDLEGKNYDYVNYDYAKAWDSSKVNFSTRQFVYLRPQGGTNDDYTVVFDRVNSVSPSYTKYFLLHSSFEPETDGTFTQERAGKWVSTNSSTVKITNTWNGSHGRLFSKTLLPISYKINKIGGPGYYWQDADGKVIYGGNLTEEEKNFRGTFTIQVQAATNQNYDNFLHVLQFGDSNTLTVMNRTTRIDGDTMVGALIDDPVAPRIVLFSKDPAGATVSSATYTADYSSTLTGKHLLADITPGTYDIYKNGVKIFTGITSQTGKNTLYFEASGGSAFQIVKTGDAPPPLKGDVQCDKAVDVLDVQALVNCILGTGSCDWGCGNSANVNGDDSIDILDVQEVVNVILGG